MTRTLSLKDSRYPIIFIIIKRSATINYISVINYYTFIVSKDLKIIRSLRHKKILGGVLFLHSLSSALKSLTSVFGMGTGVPSSLLSPRNYFFRIILSKLR